MLQGLAAQSQYRTGAAPSPTGRARPSYRRRGRITAAERAGDSARAAARPRPSAHRDHMDRETVEVHERAIAAHHGCTAWYASKTVPVQVEVDGVHHEKLVHIYQLLHHPRAT